MAGAGKDCAGAVTHQDEVRDIDWKRLTVDEWVLHAQPGIEAHFRGFLDIGFGGSHLRALGPKICEIAIRIGHGDG